MLRAALLLWLLLLGACAGPLLPAAPAYASLDARPPDAADAADVSDTAPAPAPPRPPPPACEARDALRTAREQSAARAVDFLAEYLRTPAHLSGVGSDGAGLFLELALTAESPALRARAEALAREHARRLAPLYLARGGLPDASRFADALELLLDAAAFGLDEATLGAALDQRFRRFRTEDARYGIRLARPDALEDEPAFDLLLTAYTYERASARWPRRFPVRFRLADALRVLWRRPLAPWATAGAAHTRAVESAYLATHLPLVLTEYSRHALPPEALGRWESYLRAHLEDYLRERDVELTAEVADMLRQLGERDETHPPLCSLTRFLLSTQNADGSWGNWRAFPDPYDAIHPTWAALSGLVLRATQQPSPWTARVLPLVRAASEQRAPRPRGRR